MAEHNAKHNRAVWFDIPTANLERAAKFYRAVLNIEVYLERSGDCEFCILEHHEGVGGCLCLDPASISSTGGITVYLNVDRRIKDAVAQAENLGGKVVQPIHSLGPHGFRALILDSEGNRVALHSMVNE